MGKYQAYPEYKESGIEWITEIPSHWHISNIGHESSVKARLGWKGLKADEYVDEGYVFLATPNIKGKDIDFTDVNRITKDRYDESPEIMLQTGDVLVTKDGSTTGTTNLVRVLPEPATVNSSIAVLRSKGAVDSNYLFYFFVSDYTQNVITRMRGGMGVPHLFQADLRKFSILVPPLLEQTQIANFLDHETAKIDTLIEKQQLLIKLLKEKRQAVISHAVTKGLNPHAPMKDSGVEWLGEVPEHWSIVKLSYKLKLLSGDGITSLEIEPEGKFPVFGGNGLRGYCAKYNCEGDYVLIGRQGALCGNINIATGQFFASEHAVVVYPHEQFDITFLSEFLRFMNLGQYSVSAAQPGISVERVNNLKIAMPPYNEQEKMGEFIDKRCEEYDELSLLAQKQVDLLKERRTALISAAVTGKIDVRNWQAPIPEYQAMEQTA